MEKNHPNNYPPIFFQYCRQAQNQPKSHFLFHKNGSPWDFYNLYNDVDIKWTPLNYSLCNLPSIIVSVQFLTHEFLNTLILDLFCVIEKEFFWSERTYRLPEQVRWLTGRQAGRLPGWQSHCMYTQQGGEMAEIHLMHREPFIRSWGKWAH